MLQSTYRVDTGCLSEHVYTTRIQHKIRTTRLYNTPIQHTNRRIKQKRKTSFIEVIKIRHIYLDRVRIMFILTHNNNKSKVRGKRKKIKLKTGKEVMHQSFSLNE